MTTVQRTEREHTGGGLADITALLSEEGQREKSDCRSTTTTLVYVSVLAFTDPTIKKGAVVFAETNFEERFLENGLSLFFFTWKEKIKYRFSFEKKTPYFSIMDCIFPISKHFCFKKHLVIPSSLRHVDRVTDLSYTRCWIQRHTQRLWRQPAQTKSQTQRESVGLKRDDVRCRNEWVPPSCGCRLDDLRIYRMLVSREYLTGTIQSWVLVTVH